MICSRHLSSFLFLLYFVFCISLLNANKLYTSTSLKINKNNITFTLWWKITQLYTDIIIWRVLIGLAQWFFRQNRQLHARCIYQYTDNQIHCFTCIHVWMLRCKSIAFNTCKGGWEHQILLENTRDKQKLIHSVCYIDYQNSSIWFRRRICWGTRSWPLQNGNSRVLGFYILVFSYWNIVFHLDVYFILLTGKKMSCLWLYQNLSQEPLHQT